MKSIIAITQVSLICIAIFPSHASDNVPSASNDSIAVSAPVTTDLAGKSAKTAIQSVFRIIDIENGSGGTGFLHKSGKIITAAHVVANPHKDKLKIVLSDQTILNVTDVVIDSDHDLALVTPEKAISKPPLSITRATSIPVGMQVTTWGFPAGYNGLVPLLTVGYVAGVDVISPRPGILVSKYVVNAAFNGGNSGGPLLNMEDGSVIGVVSSKLAPIPHYIVSALEALENQQSGFTYSAKTADGKEVTLTEGKIVGDVLTYLRSQTQLVIGHTVSTPDLISLLKREKIDP